MQPILHLDELRHLALEKLRHRDPRPGADDLGDVVRVHLFLEEAWSALGYRHGGFLGAEALLELDQRAVLELGRRTVVGLTLGLVDPDR